LFFNTESIFIGLGLNEYGYKQNGIDFKVEKDDYVIDGGACYGDTALYFAHDVGENGKVFSFEFLQSNLDVLNQNLELNPKLKDRITIFKNALWKNSKENLFTVENGPASFCTMKKPKNYSFKVKTKSIDDLVESGEIPRVDFIKLDIEGAELEALKGCKNTIKKFKPKLAICLYHNAEHFVSLPKYIKKLVPEYNLYIDHHTMSEGETVMYAVPPQKLV
jgi:FkbM family methyltransferase